MIKNQMHVFSDAVDVDGITLFDVFLKIKIFIVKFREKNTSS